MDSLWTLGGLFVVALAFFPSLRRGKGLVITLVMLLTMYGVGRIYFESPEIRFDAATAPARPTEVDLAYREQIFSYAMTTIAAGQSYTWESHSAMGSFTPAEPFVSKSKSYCRNYQESLTTAGGTVTADGVACKREGGEGWCRLKKTAGAFSCMFDPTEDTLGGQLRDAGGALENGTDIIDKVKGLR